MNSIPSRVLLISTQPFFQWRGSSIRVKFNLLALESLGYRVDLLAMPYGVDEAGIKARVYRAPRIPGVRDLSIGPSPAKLLLDVALLFQAIYLAVRYRYHVVHATEEGGVIAWLVARLTGARCIYEKHSDPASYAAQGLRSLLMSAYAKVEAFTARRVDAVICTGAGLERQARAYAPDAVIHHIPDIPSSLATPDEEAVDRIRRDLRESSDDVIVTYVGSFAVYQGIDLLFESMLKVLDRSPRARFLVIGGTEPEIAARRRALGEHGTRVRFQGRVPPDELPAWLKASDVLLVPRLAGINTPLKVLDYFKAGGAIVATDTAANRLILDADCARLAAPEAIAFADAIEALVADPAERRRIAEEGRRRYLERYNFDVFKSRLATVYRALRAGTGGIDAIPG